MESSEVQPDEIVSCYGTKRIENRIDQCSRRKNCPWGEACLSLANEEAAAVHYHKANISVGDLFYDPSEKRERSGISDTVVQEMLNLTESPIAPDTEIQLAEVTLTAGEYEHLCLALGKLADLYFRTPLAFEVLMKSVFKNKNQSAVARENGITRQGLNKRILHELGIAQKRKDIQERRDEELARAKQEYADKLEELRQKDDFLRSLSMRQWAVYVKVFDEGLSFGNAAKELKLHKTQVARCVRFIRAQLVQRKCHAPEHK